MTSRLPFKSLFPVHGIFPYWAVLVFALLMGLSGDTQPVEAQEENLAQYYGFQPVELFKLNRRVNNLLSGDMNHDGLNDIVLANNRESRIDVLQQRSKEETAESKEDLDINDIPNAARFKQVKIPVDYEILSMTLGDFNQDGRTDLAYLSMPDRLVVRYQSKNATWTEKKKWRLPDLEELPWTITAGDLNQDEKTDLVVLGKNALYILRQEADKGLGKPQEILNTSEKLSIAQIADINADGLNDICYLAGRQDKRFMAARLQQKSGELGPELQFELEQPRAATITNFDGQPGHELLVIDSKNGRLKVLKLKENKTEASSQENRLTQYGFGLSGGGRGRELAIGDVDGDGKTDVIATEPEAAQLMLFRQNESNQLGLGVSYPGLMSVSQLRTIDLNGDQQDEILVLSTKEKTLGICYYDNGRITFPIALPLEQEPLLVEVTDLNEDGSDDILYLSKSKSNTYKLYSLKVSRNGKEIKAESPEEIQTLSLKFTPKALVPCDVDQDGRRDLLILGSKDKVPAILKRTKEGELTLLTNYPGIGPVASKAGDLFIPKSLYPLYNSQSKFARSLSLKETSRWQVLEQFNANETRAKITGVAALDLDGQNGDEVVLVDSGVDKLRIMNKQEGKIFKTWKEIDLNGFQSESTSVADLNSDGRDDLILLGRSSFAVYYSGHQYPELEEIASFESELKKTFFADVIAGDLNADGRLDLAIMGTRSHYIEILDYTPEKGLRSTLNFKVFEEKGFRSEEGRGAEPREGIISDVTGDGLDDLILLAHDRVLIYPQDAPEKTDPATAAK